MSTIDVHTQTELDQALADGATRINLRGDARYSLTNTDSIRVEARESSSVVAWDSSRVVARDFSSVVAWDFSSVVARDFSSVVAGRYVPVQKHHHHSGTIEGGVLIELPDPDSFDPRGWCDDHGVKVADGHVVLFKAVDDAWRSGWEQPDGGRTAYEPGSTVEAADFDDRRVCGGGLHFGVTPSRARFYHPTASRFVACRVPLDGLVPLDDKAKARSCRVLHEVDVWGDPVEVSA